MGIFDFFKHKELTTIALLNKDIELAKEKEERLSSEIAELKSYCSQLSKYENIANLENEKERIISIINQQNSKFEQDKKEHIDEITSLQDKITALTKEVEQKKSQIIELDEAILLQDFGIYSPIYDFANSEMYKDRLDAVRTEQKKHDPLQNSSYMFY